MSTHDTIFRCLRIGACCALALASLTALAKGERFQTLEDAAATMAKRWQSGEKAKPIMSSDGKIVFPFGESMPQLICSPRRACDVEMEPGEKVKKVALADSVMWLWTAAESVEQGKPVQHAVFQPRDKDVETNVIIFTDRRSYHIQLLSPKVEGAYLNRIGFYYPEDIISSWEDRAGKQAEAEAKEEAAQIFTKPVAPEDMAFDYTIEGNADFKPLRVLNNGEQVFITMPDSVRTGEYPTLVAIDNDDQQMALSYRRKDIEKTGEILYVVDKLFAKAELRRGKEVVTIIWKRKQKSFWSGWGSKR